MTEDFDPARLVVHLEFDMSGGSFWEDLVLEHVSSPSQIFGSLFRFLLKFAWSYCFDDGWLGWFTVDVGGDWLRLNRLYLLRLLFRLFNHLFLLGLILNPFRFVRFFFFHNNRLMLQVNLWISDFERIEGDLGNDSFCG